jgi:hypothetical protein
MGKNAMIFLNHYMYNTCFLFFFLLLVVLNIFDHYCNLPLFILLPFLPFYLSYSDFIVVLYLVILCYVSV